MTYLLDNNIVSYFVQTRRHTELTEAAAMVPCAIVDRVEQELKDDVSRRRFFETWLPSSNLVVHPIRLGSAAEDQLARLEPELKKRGRGERASIALAANDPTLVFTAMDKNALWLALRELWSPGERVIGLPVFLRRLVEAKALARSVADEVLVYAQPNQPTPTWWADWKA